MKKNAFAAATVLVLTACGGGGPVPLGYSMPSTPQVTYLYGDTTTIEVSVMGQTMGIDMEGFAEYAVTFADRPDGVGVTIRAQELSVQAQNPMAGVQAADESHVDGDLSFDLDSEGDATITATPDIDVRASRMFSGLTTPHTFFPALPARAVRAGDVWVDTLSYSGEAESGPASENTILTYSVVGDTVVAGRDLTLIRFEGTTELSLTFAVADQNARVTADLAVNGHVLWDAAAGVMYELDRRGRGTGTANVPVAPVPLPVEIDTRQQARLGGA